jgi:hypothetical protein
MWNKDYSSMAQFRFLPEYLRSPIVPFPDPVTSGFATGMIVPTRLSPGKKRVRRFPVE